MMIILATKRLGLACIKKIREEWIHNKSAFHIARRQNKLTYQPEKRNLKRNGFGMNYL